MLANHYFPCCSETGSTCYQHYVGLEHTPTRLYCADPGCKLQDELCTVPTLLVRGKKQGVMWSQYLMTEAQVPILHVLWPMQMPCSCTRKVAWWPHMTYRGGLWPV